MSWKAEQVVDEQPHIRLQIELTILLEILFGFPCRGYCFVGILSLEHHDASAAGFLQIMGSHVMQTGPVLRSTAFRVCIVFYQLRI